MQKYVPVVSKTGKPLMPTTNHRANELISKSKALRRFSKGVFYIKLTEREDGDTQDIVVGIDPGSKKEAYTIKSESHTYLNIECNAINRVKESVKRRREARHSRRNRKTPCRKPRLNNKSNTGIPPSTQARWGWKLRICNWLKKLFPVSHFIVEDIKASTWNKKSNWNQSFSPLQIGKRWFYSELEKLGVLELRQGWETKTFRDHYGLIKSKDKMSGKFDCHCVDSWTLANWCIGGHIEPDNKEVLHVVPIQFYRRQLHVFNFTTGGLRKQFGGTRSLGFKRGSIVKHVKHGVCLVGGTSNGLISLHTLKNFKRFCQNAKSSDIEFLAYNNCCYF